MTRLGWRLKRLEEVMAPAGNEPITIQVNYVNVNGQTTDGYEVVLPLRRRMGLDGRGNRVLDPQIAAGCRGTGTSRRAVKAIAMNLKQRLASLERRPTGSESVVLHMADGRSVTFPGDCAVGMLGPACRNERTPEIELVAQSVSSTEPGGAHMIDLARAILNSPME